MFTAKSRSVEFCASARPGHYSPAARSGNPAGFLPHRQKQTHRFFQWTPRNQMVFRSDRKYSSRENKKKLTLLHPLFSYIHKTKGQSEREAADCLERNGAVEGKQREAPHHEAQRCTSQPATRGANERPLNNATDFYYNKIYEDDCPERTIKCPHSCMI